MSGIIVWIETKNDQIKKVSKECASAAKSIADAKGVEYSAFLVNNENLADEVKKLGFSKIYNVKSEKLLNYSSEGYAEAFANTGKEFGAEFYIAGASSLGKDLTARTAAKLDAGLVVDVTEIDYASSPFKVVKPVYSGKLLADVVIEANIKVLALRPNIFPEMEEVDGSGEIVSISLDSLNIRAEVIKAISAAQGVMDVSEADIICSGGRGVGSTDGFGIIEDLAKTLGGAVGSSRVAVDEGWITYDHQVGQTGKVVSPVLYIASGISGAIQHFAGMGSSKFIIAINKDPECPMMEKADFAIEGDLFQVVPILKDELAKVIG